MKKIFTAGLILFLTILSAQQDELNLIGYLNYKSSKENNIPIEGSPYYVSDFNLAKIVGTEQLLLIRYNILQDNLEFMNDEKIMIIPKEDYYKSLKFNHNGEQIDLINGTYYIKFFDSPLVSGYLKPKVKFQDFKKASSSYKEDRPAQFITLPPDYYFKSKGQMIVLPKNHREFVKLFPEQSERLSKFLKENRIKLNNKNDIIKVLKYLKD